MRRLILDLGRSDGVPDCVVGVMTSQKEMNPQTRQPGPCLTMLTGNQIGCRALLGTQSGLAGFPLDDQI